MLASVIWPVPLSIDSEKLVPLLLDILDSLLWTASWIACFVVLCILWGYPWGIGPTLYLTVFFVFVTW